MDVGYFRNFVKPQRICRNNFCGYVTLYSSQARLTEACLSEGNFVEAYFVEACFVKAYFAQINCVNAQLAEAWFQSYDLRQHVEAHLSSGGVNYVQGTYFEELC